MLIFSIKKDVKANEDLLMGELKSFLLNVKDFGLLLQKGKNLIWGFYSNNEEINLPKNVENLGSWQNIRDVEFGSYYVFRMIKVKDRIGMIENNPTDNFVDFPMEELTKRADYFTLSIQFSREEPAPITDKGLPIGLLVRSDNKEVAETVASWLGGGVSTSYVPYFALKDELPFLMRPPVAVLTFNPEGVFEDLVSVNDYFYKNPEILKRHCLICGQTGSGKTNTSKKILESVFSASKDINLLLLDNKGEYEDFARKHNILNISLGSFYQIEPLNINPFLPGKKVILKNHLDILSEIISVSGFSGAGLILPEYMKQAIYEFFIEFWSVSRDTFVKLLYCTGEELEKHGYEFFSSEGSMPTMFSRFWTKHVETMFENLYGTSSSRNLADIKTTLSARIATLLVSPINAFSYNKNSVPMDTLLDRSFVFSFQRNSTSDMVLLMSLILLLCTESLKYRGNAEKLRNLFVVEEAHTVMKREVESAEVLTATAILSDRFEKALAEIRSKGVGLIIIDQSPSLLIRSLLANTASKIVHRLALNEDIYELNSSMGVKEDLQFQFLEEGECFHKIDNSPIRKEKVALWNL